VTDNTAHFWLSYFLAANLSLLFESRPDVFVAGNLLWYAVAGNPRRRVSPDVLVVFGRPKGHRGSYRQWEESPRRWSSRSPHRVTDRPN
jgi:hypothetical protein